METESRLKAFSEFRVNGLEKKAVTVSEMLKKH